MTWVLVVEKDLRPSDLDLYHNRVLLRRDDAKERLLPLLRPSELALVERGDGINVDIYTCDQSTKFVVTFKYWPSSKAFVFNGSGWGQLCEQHREAFREGTTLRFFAPNRGDEERKIRLTMVVASNRETMDAADILVSMKFPS